MKFSIRYVVGVVCLFCATWVVPSLADAGGKTRTYYIAADEIEWDYAPSGVDHLTGKPFDRMSMMFIEQGKNRIGRTYRKAVYREYTDASFSMLKKRTAEWEHLGLLGPVIHAEVGDTIHIFLKNNGTQPMARTDGTPKDVDREFVTAYFIIDENRSWYLTQNILKYTSDPKGVDKLEGKPIDPDGNFSLIGNRFHRRQFARP